MLDYRKLKKTSGSQKLQKEVRKVKGYFVSEGYMGYVDGEYRLFADESDYKEYVED